MIMRDGLLSQFCVQISKMPDEMCPLADALLRCKDGAQWGDLLGWRGQQLLSGLGGIYLRGCNGLLLYEY